MKKALVATILGLATAVAVMAQGRINLDTYASSPIGGPYPTITYGAGVLGQTAGTGIASTDGYTVGLYYSTTAATFDDPTGVATPDGTFLLATGTGATSTFHPSFPGLFFNNNDYTIAGNNGSAAYFIVVAYNGADYASSTVRGHSAVFSVSPNAGLGGGTAFGTAMQGFQVLTVVPEPSTFALAGLGLAGLLIFRRRK
jgi:hypothetical protein